ncbi:hypothetical protein CPC08DRAFT_770680, partial [Agrocybe pediades]
PDAAWAARRSAQAVPPKAALPAQLPRPAVDPDAAWAARHSARPVPATVALPAQLPRPAVDPDAAWAARRSAQPVPATVALPGQLPRPAVDPDAASPDANSIPAHNAQDTSQIVSHELPHDDSDALELDDTTMDVDVIIPDVFPSDESDYSDEESASSINLPRDGHQIDLDTACFDEYVDDEAFAADRQSDSSWDYRS